MDIKDLIEEAGYTPKRKTAKEFSSPCPFCKKGDDRFIIQPIRPGWKGGKFSCRVCGKYGDAVKFLMELNNLSYLAACERLKIEPKRLHKKSSKQENKLLIANNPSELWLSKGNAFVEWFHAQLLANQSALEVVKKRGFTLESIKRFKLGFNPKVVFRDREEWGLQRELKEDGQSKKLWLPEGIVIPTFASDQVIKIKIRRSNYREGDKLPKYVEVSGSKHCPSIYGDCHFKVALILESELDALLIQQEVGDLVYCVALGGSTKPIDCQTDQLLRRTSLLLFCPDFDKAGAVAWDRWKKMFPAIQRILTPDGKAAGDAFLAGVNLREWIVASLESIQRLNRKIAERSNTNELNKK